MNRFTRHVTTLVMLATSTAPAWATDWLMFGNGPRHDGYTAAEAVLTPGNVSSLTRKWGYSVVAYKRTHGLPHSKNFVSIYAQPVIASDVNVSGASKSIVYFGANGGTFHAIDANSRAPAGTLIWTRQTPVSTVHCTGLTSGIKASAAIDRAANHGRGAVYVASNARVFAWDLATGDTLERWPDGGMQLPNLNPATEGEVAREIRTER